MSIPELRVGRGHRQQHATLSQQAFRPTWLTPKADAERRAPFPPPADWVIAAGLRLVREWPPAWRVNTIVWSQHRTERWHGFPVWATTPLHPFMSRQFASAALLGLVFQHAVYLSHGSLPTLAGRIYCVPHPVWNIQWFPPTNGKVLSPCRRAGTDLTPGPLSYKGLSGFPRGNWDFSWGAT